MKLSSMSRPSIVHEKWEESGPLIELVLTRTKNEVRLLKFQILLLPFPLLFVFHSVVFAS